MSLRPFMRLRRHQIPTGILAILALAASAWIAPGARCAPAPTPAPLTAYQVYSEMKSTIEGKGPYFLRSKMTPYDSLTGQPMAVLESQALVSRPLFSVNTRVMNSSTSNVPAQTLAIYDGRYFYSYAAGKHEAVRVDMDLAEPGLRAELIRAQQPPILPDLPSDKGVLRQETFDRRLCNVIAAEKLDTECHGIKKFTLWIDVETKLPRKMEAEFRTDLMSNLQTASGAKVAARPLNSTIEYVEWQFNISAPASRFGFVPPNGVRITDKEPPKSNPNCPNCASEDIKQIQQSLANSIKVKSAVVETKKSWK